MTSPAWSWERRSRSSAMRLRFERVIRSLFPPARSCTSAAHSGDCAPTSACAAALTCRSSWAAVAHSLASRVLPHLDMLGQARPGQKIKFVKTTMAKALEFEHEARATLHEQLLRLQLSLDAFAAERTL